MDLTADFHNSLNYKTLKRDIKEKIEEETFCQEERDEDDFDVGWLEYTNAKNKLGIDSCPGLKKLNWDIDESSVITAVDSYDRYTGFERKDVNKVPVKVPVVSLKIYDKFIC